jgi:hypothetical protein
MTKSGTSREEAREGRERAEVARLRSQSLRAAAERIHWRPRTGRPRSNGA